MLDMAMLRRVIAWGIAAQLAFAIVAHTTDWIAEHALLFGAMLISALAGYGCVLQARQGLRAGLLAGALAGGICGLFGASVSVVMGDADPTRYFAAIAVLAVAGATGAAFAKLPQTWQGFPR
jgi:hypothetical protein